MQLYLSIELDDCTSFVNCSMCLTEVKGWLTNHFLQLNEDKAEFIIFGNRHPEKENYGLWSFSIHGDFYLIPENVIMSHLC